MIDSLHVGEEVNGVSVIVDSCVVDNPESVQLITECAFSDDELCSIRPIQAIDAICP